MNLRPLSIAMLSLLPAVPVCAQSRPISQSGAGAYEASLATFGDGFAVAWYDTRDGHPEIYARIVDAAGAPRGPELRLTNGDRDAYEPDVSIAGSNLVVGWYETGPTSEYRAMLGSWTQDGRPLWSHRLEADGRSAKNPVVRVRDQDIFCAWLEAEPGGRNPEVHAQWFDRSGRPRGAAMRVAPAGRTTWNLNAAIDDRGRAWIAFDATAGTRAEELFLAEVDQATSTVTRLTSDDGKASKYPDIALADGKVAVSWFDERDGNQEVYLLVTPIGEIGADIDRRGVRVTRTPGESIGAYLAWNREQIGLAWCDNTTGQDEIYFERFDASGRTLGVATRLTDNPTQSLIPAIRASGSGFALVWNEFTPGPAGGHDPRGQSEVVFIRE